MQQAIVKAVPLALATALSSGLFLFMVLILMKKERQLKNGLAFLAGVLLALAAVGTIMLLAVKQADAAEPHKKTLASVVVDLALGGFLLGLLIKTTLFPVPEKVREPGAQSSKPRPLYQYFIGGVVMRLLSLDTMPPFIGVTKNIAMSHLPHAGQFAVLAFVMSVS
ncbi:MAG: GAP family protein, partial [Myxococcota bacterium]